MTGSIPIGSTNNAARPPRPPRPRKIKIPTNVPEPLRSEELTINSGEDITEKILLHFGNSSTSSSSSHGRARVAMILSATGSVMNPRMERGSSSSSYWGSYEIIKLNGEFIISGDGQVRRKGPLTILCGGPNGYAVGGQVDGHLVAAGRVEVVLSSCYK